jgi:two-component system, NtrC family, response regulator PilR
MPDDKLVLIIGTEEESRERIIATTHKCGLSPISCSTLSEARSLLARQDFHIVFCNDNLPDGDFRAVIRTARSSPVIVLSRLAEWEPYLAAINAGAFDYIACPPEPDETERILWFALRESSRVHQAAQMAA